MRRTILPLIVAAVLTGGCVVVPAAPSSAVTHVAALKRYQNCTDVRRVYSGGIAKKGVKVNRTPSGDRALKGKVKFSTALYTVNRKSDRDGDGIACEKA